MLAKSRAPSKASSIPLHPAQGGERFLQPLRKKGGDGAVDVSICPSKEKGICSIGGGAQHRGERYTVLRAYFYTYTSVYIQTYTPFYMVAFA
eukprot:NODE_4275_length_594_cov_76.488073_g3093_i0.p2 GENE.NODE_4275_length_594_cov_76.488073_g3093_i0~~NODE_4275_length_594_cov_76.488073_g3093_i0.p2  ORF type:complete len:103 (+),score=5.63 NODE_4275_length_594_cov_76.488073_g3093_i0:35-310(+)